MEYLFFLKQSLAFKKKQIIRESTILWIFSSIADFKKFVVKFIFFIIFIVLRNNMEFLSQNQFRKKIEYRSQMCYIYIAATQVDNGIAGKIYFYGGFYGF